MNGIISRLSPAYTFNRNRSTCQEHPFRLCQDEKDTLENRLEIANNFFIEDSREQKFEQIVLNDMSIC